MERLRISLSREPWANRAKSTGRDLQSSARRQDRRPAFAHDASHFRCIAQRLHLLPRAYLWGLADTLRAGVEGRPHWIDVFGHSFQGKAPWWVAFADWW